VKPVLKVMPDQRVFSGERVTLICDIQGGGNIQRYIWIRDGHTIYTYTTTTPTPYYSFTADVSHSGEYSCRGESLYLYTDFSDGVTLTVSGESSYSHLFNHHLISIFQYLLSSAKRL